MPSRPRFRLYCPQPLEIGASVVLPQEQSHYLSTVMRAREGENVAVFNGQNGEWLAVLETVSRKNSVLRLDHQRRTQRAEPDIWLLFAPIKGHRFDYTIEKATELGVSRLWPVLTRHTIVSRVREDRIRAAVIEASEQTERLTIPDIQPCCSLEDAFKNWPQNRTLFYMDETGEGETFPHLLRHFIGMPAALLIGPEGGFAKSELDALRKLSFSKAAGLGPRVLRADTAALAALTCWQALCGDWEGKPAFRQASS